MEEKILYQTLENRNNPGEIEYFGPFPCTWPNTWLGAGYYFWDTFLKNAHWWGEVRYNKNHIIAMGKIDNDTSKYFDLVGNTLHIEHFEEILDYLNSEFPTKRKKITVARVIEYIKQTGGFKYEAIRAYGIDTISKNSDEHNIFRKRVIFELGKYQYLDARPAIQFCLIKNDSLNFRDFKVVFPEKFDNRYFL